MTDFARARENMINSQVRPNDVIDPRVIAAMARVPREAFVPEHMREYAYADADLFIGNDENGDGRWLLQAMTLARMLQLAEVDRADCALSVDCASGYTTAVLAHLAMSVISVEASAKFADGATRALEEQGITNAAVVNGQPGQGWEKEAPFDVIIIPGRLERRPDALLAQLNDLGRLVAVYGGPRVARIRVWTRRGEAISHVDEFTTTAPLAPGFSNQEQEFRF